MYVYERGTTKEVSASSFYGTLRIMEIIEKAYNDGRGCLIIE